MQPFLAASGNPASVHSAGRHARRGLEDARETIASLLGAFPDEVIFTSGATEANNLALFGLARDRNPILASPIEHPCVTQPLHELASRGVPVEWLDVDARGIVRLDRNAMKPNLGLVSVMLANHETGTVQPVAEVVRSVPTRVPVHTDAAQAAGKMAIDFHALGVTALTVSGHKFGGPGGIGILLLRRGTQLTPLFFGGHQQGGRRPGTEAVALAVGMAAALAHAVRNLADNRRILESLRARLWSRLVGDDPSVHLNGPEIGAIDGLGTTLNVAFPGCRGDLLLMALDLAGVACSAGSACSSGSLLPSPVLLAMGLTEERARSSIRLSLSPTQTEAEMDIAADRIRDTVRRIRG